MDYQFLESRPEILANVYQPIKRCPSCQSVYLTDIFCESCGRSLFFHPVGEPFGAKSFYGIKERYLNSFSLFIRFFPFFENQKSLSAESYLRHLKKRFSDLLLALIEGEAIEIHHRSLFYVELAELINEQLYYGVPPVLLEEEIKRNQMETNPVVTQELLSVLGECQKNYRQRKHWCIQVLNYPLWGWIRVEFFLKSCVIIIAMLTIAVFYYGMISSLNGK